MRRLRRAFGVQVFEMYVPRVARGPAPRPPRPRVRTARLSRRVDVSAKGRRTRRALFSFFLDAPADPSRTAAFTYSTRHVSRRHMHRVLLSRVSVRRLERARDEVRARLGLERRRADGDAVETARQASVAARGDREIKQCNRRGVAGRLGARRHKNAFTTRRNLRAPSGCAPRQRNHPAPAPAGGEAAYAAAAAAAATRRPHSRRRPSFIRRAVRRAVRRACDVGSRRKPQTASRPPRAA